MKHLDELHIVKLFLKWFVLQMGTLKLRFDLKGRSWFTLGRRLCSAWSLLETLSLKSRSVNVWCQLCVVAKSVDSRAAAYVFSGRIMRKARFCSLSRSSLKYFGKELWYT